MYLLSFLWKHIILPSTLHCRSIQQEIDLLSDKTLEVKAKNKNLRQELMILVKTNKILESRMVNGMGTIDETSSGSSMIDDQSMNSFIGYNQADNNNICYPPNNADITHSSTDKISNNETVSSSVDMVIETSRATDHKQLIPESTYSSTSNLEPGKFSSTESDLILLENPRVVELHRLQQSRYSIIIK